MAADSDGARSRAEAARIVAAVASGRSLDPVLTRGDARLSPRDRAFARNLATGTIRHWYSLGEEANALLDQPLRPEAHLLDALLRIGLHQIRHLGTPPHAAVSATVAAARVLGHRGATGLVNAVLKRAVREGAPEAASEEARYDHPAWLVAHIRRDHPDAWETVLHENNARAPMTLRVNRRHGTREAWLQRLAAESADGTPGALSPDAVILGAPMPVERLPGFDAGDVSVQDEAAQLAALLLAPRPGERILDACAAPGGKTGHLLEIAPDARVTALEIDPLRARSIESNLARLGLTAEVRVGDASDPDSWWDGQPFDAILLDAPCSATGVLRRHPDAKLLHRENDIAELAGRQRALLDALWPLLAVGGRLVYCTCSILDAENEGVLAAFLAAHADATRSPDHPHDLKLLPQPGGHDGFHHCVLARTAPGAGSGVAA